MTFPEDEIDLRGKLSIELPSVDLNLATQRILQSEFDKKSLAMCKDSASIRDRAHLNTTGTASAGAWLRAIPNPNLGLSMSQSRPLHVPA